MGYVSMGDVSSDNFNSTKYPGTCKPSNVSTLATFKRLQSQLNRVAYAKGTTTIGVDGDIGPGTCKLFEKFQTELVTYAMANGDVASATKVGVAQATSCSSVAGYADIIANVADSYADSLKAPAVAPAPKPVTAPVLVSATGIETKPPLGASLVSSITSLPVAMQLAGVAVVGGILYFTWGGRKKRSRR